MTLSIWLTLNLPWICSFTRVGRNCCWKYILFAFCTSLKCEMEIMPIISVQPKSESSVWSYSDGQLTRKLPWYDSSSALLTWYFTAQWVNSDGSKFIHSLLMVHTKSFWLIYLGTVPTILWYYPLVKVLAIVRHPQPTGYAVVSELTLPS